MKKIFASVILLTFLFAQSAEACTGILRKADNGNWVFARTLEFGDDVLSFDLLYVPKGIAYSGTLPNNQKGVTWTSKYAHVGFGPFGTNLVADGLNEKGLAAGAFYLPGYAEYEKWNSQESAKTLSNLDFISWVLGNFSTVAEVRNALQNIRVISLDFQGNVIPLHYFVADAGGNRLVIEYTEGKLHVYDAHLATITNSPSYNWHQINIRNYIGLSAINRPSEKVNGVVLSQLGQGSGAYGLPGDFTPPSRFIRASFLNGVVLQGKNGWEEVQTAFKILNQFDIPEGAVREENNGKTVNEITQWTSASDLSGKKYYFHTLQSRVIRAVDITKLDPNTTTVKKLSVGTPETIADITDKLQNAKF